MNKDIRISTGFPDHHKTVILGRRLGPQGIVSLVNLWAYAGKNKVEGLLSDMSVEEIEIAAKWDGDPGKLVEELKNIRFLDDSGGVYKIHDWEDHNGYAANAKRRSEVAKQNAEKRWKRNNGNGNADLCEPHANGMQSAYERHANGMQSAYERHANGMQTACDSHADGMQPASSSHTNGTGASKDGKTCPFFDHRNAPSPLPDPSPEPSPSKNSKAANGAAVPFKIPEELKEELRQAIDTLSDVDFNVPQYLWVAHRQKILDKDAMAVVISMARSHRKDPVKEPWGYVTNALKKINSDYAIKRSIAEHERNKEEEMAVTSNILEHIFSHEPEK